MSSTKAREERYIYMTREEFKKARNFLITLMVAALLTMGAVTALYKWKGLGSLRDKNNPDASYYVPF